MKRVLIISPHFPPVNAPDHLRVRMMLPHLAANGWTPTIIAVQPERLALVADPLLGRTIPDGTEVIRVDALPLAWGRKVGLGSTAFRAWRTIRRAAEEQLRQKKFDAVFFSTTEFALMSLGARWLRRFKVPYLLDIQDPWWSDYYDAHPEQVPPGGRFKYSVMQWLARRSEPPAIRQAAHVVCVSESYVQTFRQRYPELPTCHFTTLPFGALETDFAQLSALGVRQSIFDPADGKKHWVYVGRGGDDMAFAARAFFLALKRALATRPELASRLRLHFVGTDYAPRDRARKKFEPLARELGLGDIVSEQTDRLPYFEALRCLQDADALVVPGSDDASYTASKIYPYVLAKKPLLAIFHRQSSVVSFLEKTGAGVVVPFGERSLEEVSTEISQRWFAAEVPPVPRTDWAAFAPYTAAAMTQTLCGLFNRAAGG